MRSLTEDQARKVTRRATRAARRLLTRGGGHTAPQARGLFFSEAILGCARVLSESASSRRALESSARALAEEIFNDESASRSSLREHEEMAVFIELASQDPLQLGWAYQFWNQEERDASTHAVIRKSDAPDDERSLTSATQLFTEPYMVEHVARRCLVGVAQGTPIDIIDPACGVGHFLVGALRVLRTLSSQGKPVISVAHAIRGLHGCDIDPFAVALCRAVLLLEASRIRVELNEELTRSLKTNIQVVPSPHGTLDRESGCELMRRQYGCVLTNPPYIGRRKLPADTRAFLDASYPDSAMDLCAAFMERCVELVSSGGWLGLVTVDKWLRLKGYDSLRRGGERFRGLYNELSLDCVCELGRRAFNSLADLHDGVGVVLLSATRTAPTEEHSFRYLSCVSGGGPVEKEALIRAAAEEWRGDSLVDAVPQREIRAGDNSEEFLMLGQLPLNLLRGARPAREFARVIVGLQTSDDRRFVRYHWSVPPDRASYRVHSKGGGYGRWYGFNRFLLDWGAGEPIFREDPKSGIGVDEWFARAGWTYTWFANGALGLRVKEPGWSFGRAAASGVFTEDERIIGFLNSRLGSIAARCVGGKAQLPEGVVRKLPVPESLAPIDRELIQQAIALKKELVRMDPTEVTFSAERIKDPLESLRIQATLLLIEGELETQAFEAAGATNEDCARVAKVIAPPVAWFESDARIEDHLAVRGVSTLCGTRAMRVSSGGTAGIRERIESFLAGELVVAPQSVGVPTTLPLESLCRACSIHPLDAWLIIRDLFPVSRIVSQFFTRPIARVEILEVLLELLGHRWWSDPRPWCGNLRVVSVADLLDALRRRRSDEEWSERLGEPLTEWVCQRLLPWQEKLFFRSPPVWSGGDRGGAFRHAWGALDLDSSAAVG